MRPNYGQRLLPGVLTHLAQCAGDVVHVHGQLRQPDVLLVQCGVYLLFDFGFGDVVDGEVEGDAGQYASPGGVALGYGEAVEAAAFGVRGAQQHHQVVGVGGADYPLDVFLTIQVKGSGGRSNEAVGGFQGHLGPGALGAQGEGAALHPVALSQGDDTLVLQVHLLTSARAWVAFQDEGHAVGHSGHASQEEAALGQEHGPPHFACHDTLNGMAKERHG